MRILLFFTLVFPCLVFAKDLVTWPIIDWPPIMIISGEQKGQGREDWFRDNFQKKLPQYEHQNVEMNFSKVFIELEKGRSYCFNASLKTEERVKKLFISKPYSIVVAPNIIMTKKLWESLGKPTEYSLKELAANSKYIGHIVTRRSYTEKLDKILDEVTRMKNLERKPLRTDNIILMMKLNRIQYTLEYSWVLDYNPNSKDSNFVNVRIKEIEPFLYSYVYCPKNDWGKKMIEEINTVTRSSVKDLAYRQNMEKWQDKKSIGIVRKNYHLLVEQNL